ncbi:MAG: hypothetical protein K6E84_02965 [Lachnospiraceae bacterium]|nr:hypothetical protein [Lachnospiraceae bacterium]
MKKNTNKNLFFGFLTFWFAIGLVSICLYLAGLCAITDKEVRNCLDVVNIFDESKGSFRNTKQFTDFFARDISQLSEDLAIASQMETSGRFDGEKKIDIIDYYYRRNAAKKPEKFNNLHIEYKLADLLAWARYGVNYYEIGATEWSNTYSDLSVAELSETGEIGEIGGNEDLYTVIDETFLPADGVSLYERNYRAGADVFRRTSVADSEQSEISLCDIITSAANDLNNNYRRYEVDAHFLSGVGNMKYVLLNPEGKILRSNLRLSGEFMNSDLQERSDALYKAFTDKKAYVVYTFGTASLDCGNINGYNEAEILSYVREYDYTFREGTRLMICVLDENTPDKLLGAYIPADLYGKADANYGRLSGKVTFYIGFITVLFLAALGCFIAFTVTVPTLEKEQVRGFHKIPTLLAAGIMFVLAAILAVPPLAMTEGYYSLSASYSDPVSLMLFVGWVCMFLELLAFLYGWYSLVLRIKSRTFLSNSLFAILFLGKNSLPRKFFRFCYKVLEKITGLFRNSGNILIRKIVPYICFLMVNLFILALGRMSIASIFLCLMFDSAVGVILYLEDKSFEMIREAVERIVEGDHAYQIDTSRMFDGNKLMALQVNQIGAAIENAVQQSLKDERMKTELITNVSHDIKTPLTSIINYVDLLKRENVEGERARDYIRVLDEKSQRLKVLISDLVDASKISSGNIQLNNTVFDMRELISQSLGEFEDRLSERELTVVYDKPETPANVLADSVRTWRILENLMGNVCKYAMPGSRVYVELEPVDDGSKQCLTMKNISETQLNISPRELTERFVRGDESRNTEGSGLGLSIAGDLAKLMNGSMEIHLDGDLFKVMIFLPSGNPKEEETEE